jgi:hypothetical protein
MIGPPQVTEDHQELVAIDPRAGLAELLVDQRDVG